MEAECFLKDGIEEGEVIDIARGGENAVLFLVGSVGVARVCEDRGIEGSKDSSSARRRSCREGR